MDLLRCLCIIVVTIGIGNCSAIKGRKHVVHIGVDGLKPSCMERAPGGIPNMMNRLGNEGTYTLTKARTVIETWSGPGWTATMCGMDSTSTGVLDNDWTPPWQGAVHEITPITGRNVPFPCVYDTIKQQDRDVATAAFYDWDWLRYLMNNRAPGIVDYEFYCDPSDYTQSKDDCDRKITANSSQYLNYVLQSPRDSYTFVYLGNVDEVGHENGWCSQQYLAAVKMADQQVGQILDVIKTAGAEDQTLVILHSDHGGLGNNHGMRNDDCLQIPVFLRGPGVKPNNQFLYPVRITDISPTSIYALGLEPSPWWQGKVLKEAFEPHWTATTLKQREQTIIDISQTLNHNGQTICNIPKLSSPEQ